jgi:hypothetical protein
MPETCRRSRHAPASSYRKLIERELGDNVVKTGR